MGDGDNHNAIFWRIKQEVLEDLRESLVQDLQPEKLFTFLRTKRVFDEDDCEEISAERTRRKRAEAFLDRIAKKGQDGFDYFCEAFVVCGKTQLHLLNAILDLFESKIYDNEVKPVCQYEVINIELLNQSLPCPGEPGAPCLPSYHITGIVGDQSQITPGYYAVNMNTPPPPYSEH